MSFRRQSMLLVLLTVFLRLPAVLHPTYIDDEGGYAVVAPELLQGGTLYISALDRKPPLLFWIYTAIFFVVGHYNWVALHLMALGWILLTLKVLLASTAAGFLIANTVTLWLQRPDNDLSTYVREHSTPADKVFFWGQVDYLYAEARRRPASRYINAAPLTGYIWGSPTHLDPDYDTTYRILPGAWDILQAGAIHSS